MTTLSRLSLLFALFAVIAFIASLLRRLGLGEIALILAVLALAFGVEIVRYIVKQVLKGYRGEKRPQDEAGG